MSTNATSKLPQWLVVGFSGHRKPENPDRVVEAIQRELKTLQSMYPNIATASSAASGADTLFLEVAAKLDFPLKIILPFDEERFKKDFSATDWQRVEPLIERAILVQLVEDSDTANEAYLEGGILTVDRSDLLIAVWNGQQPAGQGGTADIVRYARELEKPLLIIDDSTGEACWENGDRMPEISTSTNCSPTNPSFTPTLKAALNHLDEVAKDNAPIARNLAMWTIVLHLLASTITITSLLLKDKLPDWAHFSAISIKVLFLIAGLRLVVHLHSVHLRWTDTRPKAETCRFFDAIWPLKRIPIDLSPLAIRGQEQLVRDLEITWRLYKHEEKKTVKEAKQHYLQKRVEDQILYFERELEKSERKMVIIDNFIFFSTVTAIIAGTSSLGLSLYQHYSQAHYDLFFYSGKWLSVVLPLVTAALVSYALTQDLRRRVSRYKEMKIFLEVSKRKVEATATWNGLWRAIFSIEHQLSSEVQEWNTLATVTAEVH